MDTGSLIALIVGVVIGAGIFKTPAMVAAHTGHANLILLVWLPPWLVSGEYLWLRGLIGLSFATLGLLLLFRAGLLAYVVYHFVTDLLTFMPVTTDLTAWYAGISSLTLLTLTGLAAYGCWVACGRQPLFPPAGVGLGGNPAIAD